jgi:hypothetical protein
MGALHPSQIVDVIPVLTGADLKTIEDNLFGSFELQNNIDLVSFTNLTQSFINASFTGNLSGQGFTISNLMIDGSGNSDFGVNLALFRKLQNADIQNIVFENFNITGWGYIGALSAEFAQNITLSNINISGGFIRPSSDSGSHYRPIGALAGNVLDANIFAHNIENSLYSLSQRQINGGLIGILGRSNLILNNATQSGVVSGGANSVWLGGLIGLLERDSNVTISGIVINSNINGREDVGGLFGRVTGINPSSSIWASNIQLINSKVKSTISNEGHLIGNLIHAKQVKFENVNVTNGENIKLIGTTGLTLHYSIGDDTSKTTFSNASIDN